MTIFEWVIAILSIAFGFLFLTERRANKWGWDKERRYDRVALVLLIASVIISAGIARVQIDKATVGNNDQIEEIKRIEREKQLIGIVTLRKELEENHAIMLGIIELKQSSGGAIMCFLKVSAYEQGMATRCLTDENLINDIFDLYYDLNIINFYIKLSHEVGVRGKAGAQTEIDKLNKEMMKITKDNVKPCSKIIKQLKKIERSYRDNLQ